MQLYSYFDFCQQRHWAKKSSMTSRRSLNVQQISQPVNKCVTTDSRPWVITDYGLYKYWDGNITRNFCTEFASYRNYIKIYTVHDLKLSHFFRKKLQKVWQFENIYPKKYYFWTIINQKKGKKCDNLTSWTVELRTLYRKDSSFVIICIF